MKRISALLLLPLALVLAGCPRPQGPVAPVYDAEAVDLDRIEPGASALNNEGEVVGSVAVAQSIYQAAVWIDGDVTPLADPDDAHGMGAAISENGAVAGISVDDLDEEEAVALWTYGTPSVVDDLEGESVAYGVNDFFEVVGAMTDDETDVEYPMLWSPLDLKLNSKPLQTFDNLGGLAYDINNAGISVGYSRNNTGPMDATAVMWDVRGIQEIGGLGGDFSAATAINDFNNVVGYSTLATGPTDVTHGWFYNGEEILDLETLGGASSLAGDVNDLGLIVGWSINADGDQRATLWIFSIRQGKYVAFDLNEQIDEDATPGVVYEDALDINDEGQIVVQGRLDNGTVVYSLLTP